jgi:hypothetical protein
MKKILCAGLLLTSFSTLAAGPEFNDLSKKQLEDVGNEFAVNFSHTAVAAPETNGLWGVEVGLIAGQTGTPELKKAIDQAGEDGSKFKNLYTAGLMARAHFPFELFAEMTTLPKRDISDVEVSNQTFGLGWNLGRLIGLPLDLALGANFSNSDIKFSQVINNTSTGLADVNSDMKLSSKSNVYWVGASKTFLFVTPYVKVGTASTKSDLDIDASNANATVFNFTASQKANVSSSGSYLAVGANLQFFLFRFGVEASNTIGVKRVAGKFSIAF